MPTTSAAPEPHQSDLDIEDPAQLLAYLRSQELIQPGETPQLETLAGGVSNRTVRVTRADGSAWVIKQALAKLRVPVDWFSSPERVHREALGLRWLGQLAPIGSTPGFIKEDFTNHLLIMQAVPHPHENWKVQLLRGEVDLSLIRQFGQLLSAIHTASAQRHTEVQPAFADPTFFESLRLEPYYAYTAQQISAARPFLTDLIQQTRERSLTLVHGDYSPKNVLIHKNRLILLDHEVIHWGDPAFDLGFSMTHLLSKAHHLPFSREAFTDAAHIYWLHYWAGIRQEIWAANFEHYGIRHTLACLLSRVAGRSPLEYLTQGERQRQQRAVLALMADPPKQMPALIDAFVAGVTG